MKYEFQYKILKNNKNTLFEIWVSIWNMKKWFAIKIWKMSDNIKYEKCVSIQLWKKIYNTKYEIRVTI